MEPTIGSPAGENNNCGCIQIIDGEGGFNFRSCQKFLGDVKLADSNPSNVVVSIIGPQSSGKSTILNRVFGTTFAEMNASKGRSKTTNGIWLQKADITKHCILVMDLEGTDGKERQDKTAFEKQSAVFALLTSDVVLINMWYKDIGLHDTANRPLFETVFQAVVRSFSPRKTTLVFVIRDTDVIKTSCSIGGERSSFDKHSKSSEDENLKGIEHSLKEDIRQIWDSFSKPEAHERTSFSAFYNVKVVFLPHFIHQPMQFETEVARLRQWFHGSIASGVLAGDWQTEVDGSSFSYDAQQLWDKIKNNKDLDLPPHKKMVPIARCKQIADEQFESFDKSEKWVKLREAVRTQTISGFGKELSKMINDCLTNYDEEATYFDEDVKSERRKQLEETLVQHVHPTCRYMLQRIKSESLENFKKKLEKDLQGGGKFIDAARNCVDYSITQFEEKYRDARIDQANRGELVKVLGELRRDIASHINTVFEQKRGEDGRYFNKMVGMGRGAVKALSGSFGSVVGVGAIGSAVGVGLATGAAIAGVGLELGVVGVGVGVGVAVAVAVAVADEKREMAEVKDYIVELCGISQLNAEPSNGPSSVSEENQLDVEWPSSEDGEETQCLLSGP